MEQKTIRNIFPVAFVVLVAFLSTLLFADVNQSVAATAKRKSVVGANAVDRTEVRIKELQGALKITEEQQVLWNALIQVMRDNAKEMETLAKVRVESTQVVNAVENMKFYYQVSQIHLEQQAKFIPPFEALYTSLSDGQKQTEVVRKFETGV